MRREREKVGPCSLSSVPRVSHCSLFVLLCCVCVVCKDYKETGRCGYGDSCVFMHDRGVRDEHTARSEGGERERD